MENTKEVALRTTGKTVILTEDETAALEAGLRSEQSARLYTLEEALQFAQQRRQSWAKTAVAAGS